MVPTAGIELATY